MLGLSCSVVSCSFKIPVIISHRSAKLLSTGYLSQHIKTVARNLGVLFNSNFCFEQHIIKLFQSFYQLRNIAKIRPMLLSLHALATATASSLVLIKKL